MSMRLPVCDLPANHPVPTNTGQNCFSTSQAGVYIFKCLELHQYKKLVISENLISFRTHFVALYFAYEFTGRLLMFQSQVFALRSFSMNGTDSIVIMANSFSGVPQLVQELVPLN